MTNKELIAALAQQNAMTQTAAAELLETTVGVLLGTLKNQTAVTLTNLGTLEVKQKSERILTNPKTGQRQLLPPRLALNFKASKNSLK